jgi:uncharacterized membrane protein YbhN (UPF0104 family)
MQGVPALDAPIETPRANHAMFYLKLTITVAAVAFIFTRQPIGELVAAARQLTPLAFVLATLLQYVALTVGTLRWGLLMRAYGAKGVPALGQLFKVYLVGHFYNTYLPGGVGGDVMRGVVTRRAFGEQGATGAMSVVLVERVLGMAGVVALTGIATAVFAGNRFGNLLPYSLLVIAGIAAGLTALAHGNRLARFFPNPIKRILASLPRLVGYGSFTAAALLSLMTHTIMAVVGHVLVSSMKSDVPWSDSFLAMPLAVAMGFFPLTVAGAGARDLVLINLYEVLGVPRAVGTATALAFLCSTLVAAGVGGIAQLLSPLDLSRDTDQC